ncbi:MAG: BREX-3 system phosphatase PglZ [Anaerolineae bacterium]|nr:BREX-3 system phosphatase PglZ [Anaerolineae bacterium]
MLERILAVFPAQTHPLYLASDPDDVLADEVLLATLAARGFTLIREGDPVTLRARVEAARPWTPEHPLLVVTSGLLEALPYDLWQQGQHVTLALHTFFPNLAYPVVRTLSTTRRARLAAAPSPARTLGPQATQDYILRHAFGAAPAILRQPAQLIAWLDTYHQERDPLPAALCAALLSALQTCPPYAEWPLESLLCEPAAFAAFVREQWTVYVEAAQRGRAAEPSGHYLDFGVDTALQDALSRLVRTGTLAPVEVARPERLPGWARPAVLASAEDRIPRRAAELLASVTEQVASLTPETRWPECQRLAWDWAELTALRYQPETGLEATGLPIALLKSYDVVQSMVDAAFEAWLPAHYAALATQSLPEPHHLYHVPHYLAYHYLEARPVALLILDGMALADWTVIRRTWQARQPGWRVEERLVLAQLPTITSVSRQALVSGRRPVDFADSLGVTRKEPQHWQSLGERLGLAKNAVHYAHLRPGESVLPDLPGARVRWLCWVDTSLDDVVHSATLGHNAFYAALNVWLNDYAPHLEAVIAGLLAQGFVVALTSDHGHTEGRGFGALNEGLTVETRSQRSRLYTDPLAAERARGSFAETILWRDDGLLPPSLSVVMPRGRLAFASYDATVVTHGGASIDEVIVPLVILTKNRDFS